MQFVNADPIQSDDGTLCFGHLDNIGTTVEGWAFSRNNTTPPVLELILDDCVVARLPPIFIREDIARLFNTALPTGFSFSLTEFHPDMVKRIVSDSDRPARLEVRFYGSDFALPGPDHSIAAEQLTEVSMATSFSDATSVWPQAKATYKDGRLRITGVDLRSNYSKLVYSDLVLVYSDRLYIDNMNFVSHSGSDGSEFSIIMPLPEISREIQLVYMERGKRCVVSLLLHKGSKDDHFVESSTTLSNFALLDRIYAFRDISQLSERRAIALFAMHNRGQTLTTFQLKIIQILKIYGYAICVVNSWAENEDTLASELHKVVDIAIFRGDIGRDFGSWAVAITCLNKHIVNFEHILLINDSILGPVCDMQAVFSAFDRFTGDIFGLTDSYQQFYHLQSSVLFVRRSAFRNSDFMSFFVKYSFPSDKDEVIRMGEIGLTRCAIENGLRVGVMCPYEDVARKWFENFGIEMARAEQFPEWNNHCVIQENGILRTLKGFSDHYKIWNMNIASDLRGQTPRNAQHVFWDTIIREFGYPFVKKELVTRNPDGIVNLHLLEEIISPEYKSSFSQQLWEAFLQFPGKAPSPGLAGSSLRFNLESGD